MEASRGALLALSRALVRPARRLLLASLLAIAAACATPRAPARIRDTALERQALGLGEAVAPWEDGRRTPPGGDGYEWWYLDGVSKDGTVIVVVFSDNWLPGTHTRRVTIDVTTPGQPTRKAAFTTPDPGAFAADRADVRLGRSRLEGDLDRYAIHVDPGDAGGLGCALVLERRVPSYRPGTGVFGDGDAFFAWVVPVPEGRLTGTVTIDGKVLPFTGSGYHDHNWGNVPPWKLLRGWWWGRGEVAGRTVVMAELRPAAGRGERASPLVYIAGGEGVVAEAHGDAARFAEGPPGAEGDPLSGRARAASVRLEASAGVSVRFTRHGAPLTSLDLLQDRSGLVRLLARIAGRAPSYTRWQSTITVDEEGTSSTGEGTLEYMDFE